MQLREALCKKANTSIALLGRNHASYATTRIFNVAISPRYEMNVAMRYCLPGCNTDVYADIERTNPPIRPGNLLFHLT